MRLRSIPLLPAAAIGFAFGLGYVAPAVASDWYDAEYQSCDQESTATIVECLTQLHDKWDARLNAAYQTAMGQLDGDRADELRDVQRAWIAYRDANCLFYRMGEGTIAAIEGNACMFGLTRDRALELETMNSP
jgi:uncharacterized protein YecT (DUF1311 family)